MGCGTSVPVVIRGVTTNAGQGSIACKEIEREVDDALQALRDRRKSAFATVAMLMEQEAGQAQLLDNDLLEEILSALKDTEQQKYHEEAGAILETLYSWALDKANITVQRPKIKVYESAVRCLVRLVEHVPQPKEARREANISASAIRRTGSNGMLKRSGSSDSMCLKRTSSFESNEHGLYPELVVDLKKPYRIRHVNGPWEKAFGHEKQNCLGRTINLMLGPDTDTEKVMGILKETELEGSARGLLAFHDAEGDSMMVTLTATGIFGAAEDDDDQGVGDGAYRSAMLVLR